MSQYLSTSDEIPCEKIFWYLQYIVYNTERYFLWPVAFLVRANEINWIKYLWISRQYGVSDYSE